MLQIACLFDVCLLLSHSRFHQANWTPKASKREHEGYQAPLDSVIGPIVCVVFFPIVCYLNMVHLFWLEPGV